MVKAFRINDIQCRFQNSVDLELVNGTHVSSPYVICLLYYMEQKITVNTMEIPVIYYIFDDNYSYYSSLKCETDSD